MSWREALGKALRERICPRSEPPAPQPGKENPVTPQTPKRRPWTFMVYMAGDNGKVFDTQYGKLTLMAEMTSAGYKDLMKMGTVGTTDNVAVACLFDTQDATYQVEVRKGNGWSDSLVQQVPEVNTGDRDTLRRFIVDTVKAYPADHYALVIWNHGAGWLDLDAYATVRAVDANYKTNPAIFRTTPKRQTGGDKTRPIAFDDSSKDFLDSQDLDWAFAEAQAAAGVRLDLIGMDACLMAMVEGAWQLAPFADYFVASQEIEPMAGWPYGPILSALDAQPGLPPDQLSVTVVEEYAKSYGGTTRAANTVTQSAIVLGHVSQTETLCKALVDAAMTSKANAVRTLIQGARDQALVFEDRNYRDLGDFAAKLAEAARWSSYPAVTAAAKALADHLQARGAGAPVLRVGFLPGYKAATGMSVFLPPKTVSADRLKAMLDVYRPLRFVQATGWDHLLDWVYSPL